MSNNTFLDVCLLRLYSLVIKFLFDTAKQRIPVIVHFVSDFTILCCRSSFMGIGKTPERMQSPRIIRGCQNSCHPGAGNKR